MKQGDKLQAIKPFILAGKGGHRILIKSLNRFEIVTDEAFHKQNQGHCLKRTGRGRLSSTWFFSDDQLKQYFEVVKR